MPDISSYSFLGVQALINMLLTIILIAISWWALQVFKFDLFIRDINSPQFKVLQIMIAIIMGYVTASFFIDYMEWTQWLIYRF